MVIVDKNIIKGRFNKTLSTYNSEATVQKKVIDRFGRVIHQLGINPFNKILEVGCGTGFLSKKIVDYHAPSHYYLNDLNDILYPAIGNYCYKKQFANYSYLPGDAEDIVFPENIDAVLSTSTVQWFHNLQLFINKVNYHLAYKGIFAFSTFGENNFSEIRRTLGIGLNYISKNDIEGMVKVHFNILHSEEWTEQLFFESPRHVLKHIKNTGVNGLAGFCWSKSKLTAFEKKYMQLFQSREKVRLTYHPIIIIAQKR